MDARLIQQFSQKLILSPQIRQYLKVLQMPLTELQSAIDEFLAENPVVEQKTDEGVPADHSEDSEPDLLKKEPPSVSTRELEFGKDFEKILQLEEQVAGGYATDSEDRYMDPSEVQKTKDFHEMILTKQDSLSDFMLWQVRFMDLSGKDFKIAQEIIGNLDERGYVAATLDEIAASCQTSQDRVKKVLAKLQELDPPGIFARDLQETLLIQLRKKNPASPPRAVQIVSDHFAFLAKHDWQSIAKKIGVEVDEVRKAGALIASLEPHPGRMFYGEVSLAVIPDVIVLFDEEDNTKLKMDLRDEIIPQIRINPYYRKLLRDDKTDETAKKYIREKIQSAMDFMNAMKLRGSTLREIAEVIVKSQRDFFSRGFTHLKPMRLKDISSELGIHESTVSRAIRGKYMSTPQGTIPLRSFFSTKIETADGEGESQKSMTMKIKQMIAEEDPKHPLSDQAVANRLKTEGMNLARRTVTKYRELEKILPSHLRRRR
ncbi:MAG: RNA polymerase sigma-54 factor [Candidatus Omnitrophica bacterium]|nr:RNA polymerase sigma-54 factor [Candidatus Omnitrophota bacterium]